MTVMTVTPRKLAANTILAQNLLLARLAVDWTQHTLAGVSGVSRATIAQIEAGIGDPRLSTIELLATALGVPTAVLLFGKPEVQGLVKLVENPPGVEEAQELDEGTRGTLEFLADSGVPKNRLEAARIGVTWVQQLGHEDQAHVVGAALGAVRYPQAGILINARLAHLISGHQHKPQEKV